MGRAHVGQALRSVAVRRMHSPVTLCGDRVCTGSELVRRVAALSSGLRNRLGLLTGQTVAIAALNSDWYFEWLLAVPCAGGIIAPLNYRWSAQEASDAILQIKAKFIVVDHSCMWWCSEIKNKVQDAVFIMLGEGLDHASFFLCAESILQQEKEHELQLHWNQNSIALICFTSGTTGRPKGAAISHNALIIQSLAKIAAVHYSHDDVYLHTSPLCHIGGISSSHAMLMAGGCHIFLPKFEVCTVMMTIERFHVTAMITVPTMLNDIMSFTSIKADNQAVKQDYSSVRKLLNGAGSLSMDLIQKTHTVFPEARIYSAYGMTEACSSMTFMAIYDPREGITYKVNTELSNDQMESQMIYSKASHLGGFCVGKPAPHVEIAIRSYSDDSCKMMNLFKEGSVLVRGSFMMTGYWGGDEVIEGAFDVDGWFDTGDVGWIDNDGNLWLLGRHKDVIKSGGENVHAFEVEMILSKHPGIEVAAVVGVPDLRLNETVAAMLILRDGWKWENVVSDQKKADSPRCLENVHEEQLVSPNLVQQYCQKQGLSRYKVPRIIINHEGKSFPLTSTGKVRKNVIRQDICSYLHSQHEHSQHSRL